MTASRDRGVTPARHAAVKRRLDHRRVEAEAAPEVMLFIVDAGGGHRATANALVEAARRRSGPGASGSSSLQDVFAPLDFWRRLTGRPMEETYNGWCGGGTRCFLRTMLRVFQWLIRRMEARLCRLLTARLSERLRALVVSLVPNFNAVIATRCGRCLPGTPFFVLLTDFADLPPHFWLERDLDRVIVGSEHAVAQALQAGLPRARISRTSGMILHPRFYPRAGSEARERVRREMASGGRPSRSSSSSGARARRRSGRWRRRCWPIPPGCTSSRSAATTRTCSRAWRAGGPLRRAGCTASASRIGSRTIWPRATCS